MLPGLGPHGEVPSASCCLSCADFSQRVCELWQSPLATTLALGPYAINGLLVTQDMDAWERLVTACVVLAFSAAA